MEALEANVFTFHARCEEGPKLPGKMELHIVLHRWRNVRKAIKTVRDERREGEARETEKGSGERRIQP